MDQELKKKFIVGEIARIHIIKINLHLQAHGVLTPEDFVRTFEEANIEFNTKHSSAS